MGFGERVYVIVACDVLVRNAGVVGNTVFGFRRTLCLCLILYLRVVLLFVVWRVYWY